MIVLYILANVVHIFEKKKKHTKTIIYFHRFNRLYKYVQHTKIMNVLIYFFFFFFFQNFSSCENGNKDNFLALGTGSFGGPKVM